MMFQLVSLRNGHLETKVNERNSLSFKLLQVRAPSLPGLDRGPKGR